MRRIERVAKRRFVGGEPKSMRCASIEGGAATVGMATVESAMSGAEKVTGACVASVSRAGVQFV